MNNALMILIVASISSIVTRFAPFVLLKNKGDSEYVKYLGEVLPAASMGLLIVYCMRHVTFDTPGNFAPEFIVIALIFIMHKLKLSNLLTVVGGTVAYMILKQFVF